MDECMVCKLQLNEVVKKSYTIGISKLDLSHLFTFFLSEYQLPVTQDERMVMVLVSGF